MTEAKGDIWHMRCDALVVPTNGAWHANGKLIMGKGMAQEAKTRWPRLPESLGLGVRTHGNIPLVYPVRPRMVVVTCPTKHHYREPADIALVEHSCRILQACDQLRECERILLPWVGCGEGGLDWVKEVRPLLREILDDRFLAVERR